MTQADTLDLPHRVRISSPMENGRQTFVSITDAIGEKNVRRKNMSEGTKEASLMSFYSGL